MRRARQMRRDKTLAEDDDDKQLTYEGALVREGIRSGSGSNKNQATVIGGKSGRYRYGLASFPTPLPLSCGMIEYQDIQREIYLGLVKNRFRGHVKNAQKWVRLHPFAARNLVAWATVDLLDSIAFQRVNLVMATANAPHPITTRSLKYWDAVGEALYNNGLPKIVRTLSDRIWNVVSLEREYQTPFTRFRDLVDHAEMWSYCSKMERLLKTNPTGPFARAVDEELGPNSPGITFKTRVHRYLNSIYGRSSSDKTTRNLVKKHQYLVALTEFLDYGFLLLVNTKTVCTIFEQNGGVAGIPSLIKYLRRHFPQFITMCRILTERIAEPLLNGTEQQKQELSRCAISLDGDGTALERLSVLPVP